MKKIVIITEIALLLLANSWTKKSLRNLLKTCWKIFKSTLPVFKYLYSCNQDSCSTYLRKWGSTNPDHYYKGAEAVLD